MERQEAIRIARSAQVDQSAVRRAVDTLNEALSNADSVKQALATLAEGQDDRIESLRTEGYVVIPPEIIAQLVEIRRDLNLP